MAKQIINPSSMAKPTGYSYAVKKPGTPIFIAGQVALDGAGIRIQSWVRRTTAVTAP